MRNWASKILVPALIVGAAAAQSIGIDAGRATRMQWALDPSPQVPDDDVVLSRDSSRNESRDTIVIDSAALARKAFEDSLRYIRDSIKIDSLKVLLDSLGSEWMDSSDLAMLDSLEAVWAGPVFNPADTVVIPAGLDTLDPFKFKYYVAIKDTNTLRRMRDSLLAIPDSVELGKLDSLYYKDSTEVAHWRFTKWYQSLSRKERKKYDYEQALPAKVHRMDSIMNRKDSLKAVKDSITEATPRILETYVLADSLQYKRLITWQHDRKFNDIRLQKFDTTFNYHFYDYPFYKEDIEVSYLGVHGSATQSYNWFKRRQEQNVVFYTPYQVYSYTAENLPMYNTKTPYTELAYWGTLFSNSDKEESNIKILTTQNITPELNLTLEYHRYGGKGMLQNENTDNRTAVIAGNYLGKRYLSHFGFIYNRVNRGENGGAIDTDPKTGINWIRDTTLKDVREVPVHLPSAASKMRKNTVFLDQSYRIPFNFVDKIKNRKLIRAEKEYKDSLIASGDSAALADFLLYEQEKQARADTLNKDIMSGFIGHSSEYSVFRRSYTDKISAGDEGGRSLFENYFFNPTTSADSMRVMRLDNKIYLRLQPWKSDGIVSKLDVGVGDKLLNYYDFSLDSYLGKKSNVTRNSVYLYAGVQGQYKKYLKWGADGRYTFAGAELNDFGVNADVELNFFPFRRHKNEPLTLKARFSTALEEPDYYQQHFHSNHFRWDNDFGKISTTRVEASLDIPRWKLSAEFGYGLLSGNIYYDTKAVVQQNTSAMSVITAGLNKEFVLWKFHLDNHILFQYSSNEEVLPLPMLTVNLRWYFQFNVVKNVMKMQVGANAWYNLPWYAPSYNPVAGVFYNQTEYKYGNNPYIDVFANIQWKRACIFLKCINVNQGWPARKTDMFSANHYVKPMRAFKIGVFWPFYVQPGKHKHGDSEGGTSGGHSGGGRSGGGRSAGIGGIPGLSAR